MFQDKGDWSRRQRQDAGAGARPQEHEQAREDGTMRPILLLPAAPTWWSLFRATARWFSAALSEVAGSVSQFQAFVSGADDLDIDSAVRPVAGLVRG